MITTRAYGSDFDAEATQADAGRLHFEADGTPGGADEATGGDPRPT